MVGWASGLGRLLSAFQENNMVVYVEKKVLDDPAIVGDDSFGPVKRKFCTFREGEPPASVRWLVSTIPTLEGSHDRLLVFSRL